MTVVDYTLLFAPTPHLYLHYDPTSNLVLRWSVRDANLDGALFTRAASLDHAIAFVRAAERNGDATVDESSVEYWRAFRLFGDFSMRVPDALSEREASLARGSVATDVAGVATTHGSDRERPRSESASLGEAAFTGAAAGERAASSNVVPIRREIA